MPIAKEDLTRRREGAKNEMAQSDSSFAPSREEKMRVPPKALESANEDAKKIRLPPASRFRVFA